jgi:Tfp pilus assembly protein PilP
MKTNASARRPSHGEPMIRRPMILAALALGLGAASLHRTPVAHADAASDPVGAQPAAPQMGQVKATAVDALKEAVGMKPGEAAPAGAPAAAAVVPGTPSDPATRAAALRRKALKDLDFIDSDETNRDPFKSFFRAFVEKGPSRLRQVPALFEKFALEELGLIAIVSGDAQPRAMFRDPSGLGQTVKRGDYISKVGARITKILSDRVILEMNEPTANGEPRATEKAVLVHPEEEAQK